MPTAREIDRLREVMERLSALGNARRGGPIRASDWNALVSAVRELARSVLGTDDADAVVQPHDHVGEVQLSWLAPEVRRPLESVGRPQDAWYVADLRRAVARQDARLEAVGQDLDRARGLVTGVRTRDTVREAELNRLRTLVDGARDEREDLARLRAGLERLRSDVARVAEVGAGLEVDGEPVDLADVARRVGQLEGLRERLTRPDGSLLDASMFETRLAGLRADLVTENRLEEALEASTSAIPDDVVAGIEERVQESVRGILPGRLDELSEAVRADVTERLSDVDARIARHVETQRPEMIAQVASELRGTIEDAARRAADAALGDARTQLEATEERLRTFAQEQVSTLEERLPDLIGGAVERRIEAATASLSGGLEDLRERLEREAARVDEQEQKIGVIRSDVASSIEVINDAQDRTRRALEERIRNLVRPGSGGGGGF